MVRCCVSWQGNAELSSSLGPIPVLIPVPVPILIPVIPSLPQSLFQSHAHPHPCPVPISIFIPIPVSNMLPFSSLPPSLSWFLFPLQPHPDPCPHPIPSHSQGTRPSVTAQDSSGPWDSQTPTPSCPRIHLPHDGVLAAPSSNGNFFLSSKIPLLSDGEHSGCSRLGSSLCRPQLAQRLLHPGRTEPPLFIPLRPRKASSPPALDPLPGNLQQ